MPARMLLLTLGVAIAATSSAHAATWRQVTDPGASTDQVGIVRTPDRVLHVAWHRANPNNTADLFHTRIEPNGRVGARSPIQTGWTGFMDAALTLETGGIRAYWGAIRSTDPNDDNQELNTALSPDGGARWVLQEDPVVRDGGQAYASDVSATVLPNGTPLQAWAGTLGTWVHAGLSPGNPNHNYMEQQQYGYFPGIASNARGQAMMAWFSSAAARRGVLAQAVGPDGAPAGAYRTLPGSSVMAAGGTSARTPIVARGSSFYVAYPVGSPAPRNILLWRVGPSGPRRIARVAGAPQVALAVDPRNRMWVIWAEGPFGAVRVLARRSNPSLTEFGATVDAGAVRGTHTVHALDASALEGSVDALAHMGTGTSSSARTFVTRILPGLTLRASRTRRSTTFTVTDAGVPVPGATVAGSRTNSAGRVRVAGRRSGVFRATKQGYTAARLRLR